MAFPLVFNIGARAASAIFPAATATVTHMASKLVAPALGTSLATALHKPLSNSLSSKDVVDIQNVSPLQGRAPHLEADDITFKVGQLRLAANAQPNKNSVDITAIEDLWAGRAAHAIEGGLGIAGFPVTPPHPTTLITPADQVSLPALGGYDTHIPLPIDAILPGSLPTGAVTTPPGRKALSIQPQDLVLLSEGHSTSKPLDAREAALRARVDSIMQSDQPIKDRVRQLVELNVRYNKIKQHLKHKDDAEAYRFTDKVGENLHAIISGVVEHQQYLSRDIKERYGVNPDADDYDPSWYKNNPQASAEMTELFHRPYDAQSLFDFAEAIVAHIIAGQQRKAVNFADPDSPSTIDFFKWMKGKRDLLYRFLGS